MSISSVSSIVPCLDLQMRCLDGGHVQQVTVTGQVEHGRQMPPTENYHVEVDLSPIQQGYKDYAIYIDQVIRKIIIPTIWTLIKTKKSQKVEVNVGDYGPTFDIKARFVGKKIQVLLSEFIDSGSNKKFYKVTLLAGPRLPNQPSGNIFGYAKILALKGKRAKIEELERAIKDSLAANKPQEEIEGLQKQKQKAQDKYGEIVEKLIKETEISHILTDAAKSWIIAHIKDPSSPKGLIMEFVDSISSYEIFPTKRQDLDHEKLKRNIRLAIRFCEDLAQMHKAGYVYMDFRERNFLFENMQGKIGIKLIDFGMCAKAGTSTLGRGWNYAFLPEIPFVDPDCSRELKPLIASFAMDAYVLSFVIGNLVYGGDASLQYPIRRLYQRHEHKPTPWEWLKHLIRKPMPSEELKNLVQKKLGTYPKVDEVLCHLWDQKPTTRWTPEQAATELQKFLTEIETQ